MPALTILHAKSDTIADWAGVVTVNNSTGGTVTKQGTDLVRPVDWNSGHNFTFTLSQSDVASLFFCQMHEPFPFANSNSVSMTYSGGVWALDPFLAPDGLGSGRFNLFNARDSSVFLNTLSANSSSLGGYSLTGVFMQRLAIYSQGAGTNASLLTNVWTGQADISFTQSQTWTQSGVGGTAVGVTNALTIGMITNVDVSGGSSTSTQTASGTFSTGVTSCAATRANSLITAAQNWFTGSCMDMIPFASTLSPGNYWMAYMHSTNVGGGGTTGVNRTSAGTWFNATQSRYGILDANMSAWKKLGRATSADSSTMAVPFHGSLLTAASTATGSLGTVDLQMTTRRIYWNFVQGSHP